MKNGTIKYNEKIEVSKKEYLYLVKNFSGIVAHKKENNKYYVKVMLKKYVELINKMLDK